MDLEAYRRVTQEIVAQLSMLSSLFLWLKMVISIYVS
jgi:hypothetical protein